MSILKFNLSGKFAHFRIPEVNNINLTFLQIHKTIIKGIVGAIVGLDGYNTAKLLNKEVEFLNKLENIKVGIIPNADKGIFPNKIEKFTNTTGHASREEGGTLIVEEKILINPSWDIYLDLSNIDTDLKEKIEDYFLNSNSEYLPYLGKNHYNAIMKNVEIIDKQLVENPEYCSSLFIKNNVELDSDIVSKEDLVYGTTPFISSFFLPIDMNIELGYKNYNNFIFTNLYINYINSDERMFIKDNKKIIELF